MAASRLNGRGRVLMVQRVGQSLAVSMRAPSGAPDGSTAAERAERAVRATCKPLGGLLKSQVSRMQGSRVAAAAVHASCAS